jgi:hypothetical protein
MSLASQGGKNAKMRARIAVARKLVILMHRIWITQEIYQPLRGVAEKVTYHHTRGGTFAVEQAVLPAGKPRANLAAPHPSG